MGHVYGQIRWFWLLLCHFDDVRLSSLDDGQCRFRCAYIQLSLVYLMHMHLSYELWYTIVVIADCHKVLLHYRLLILLSICRGSDTILTTDLCCANWIVGLNLSKHLRRHTIDIATCIQKH